MIKKITSILITLLFINSSLFAEFYYSNGKKHYIDKVKTSREFSNSTKALYEAKNGTKLKIDNAIIVSFSDISKKEQIEAKYNLKLKKKLTKQMYLYTTNSNNTLEIANKIYEEKSVKFSHPDFKISKKKRVKITQDPLVYDSWHLYDNWSYHGDVNVRKAWEYTKGEGVKVAVYDKGIDIQHPDLKENIFAFRNYNDPNSNVPDSPSGENEWHGTACAGIIVASENRLGSVGVAPKASLYAVGYSENEISEDIEAFKWMMDENVSVINNSWGSYSALDAYTEIFKELATEGRDGKGIIIIFAAGNEGQNLDEKDINDESESKYVLSIAASGRANIIASYSNYGSAIDFTAPGGTTESGIITTDATGRKGYNDGDYNTHFMGTSAAAPIVSGTVALMLAVNPKLTRKDIIKILKYTADKKGRYEYDSNGFNVHWGYGKIDAGNAVALSYSYGNSKLKNFARTMYNALLR